MIRISTNIPACISGAADWVLKRSASEHAPARRDDGHPHHDQERDREAAGCRASGRRARTRRTSRNVAGTSDAEARPRARARRGATGRGAGEASRRSNQPCSMSRARLTPVAAPVNPAALHQADRDEEALVAVGREAAEQRQVAEHRRQPEEEDRRREHARDRRPGHAQELVERRGASARATVSSCGARALIRPSSAGAAAPARSARGRARRSTRSRRSPSRKCFAVKVEITGSRTPSTMKLSGFHSATDRGRLEQQLLGEERGGEEEDHEDEREQPLDDRRLAALAARSPRRCRRTRRPSSVTKTIISSAPGTPSSIRAPKISPIARNQTADSAPSAAVPASRPSTIAKREIGAAKQAVGESHLDVDRERDPAAVARPAASTGSSLRRA